MTCGRTVRARVAVLAVALTTLASGCAGEPAGPTEPPRPAPTATYPATGSPWRAAMVDARHSGATTTVGPRTGTVRWERKLEAAVSPGPVVGADGTVYAASNGGVLHALNPVDGSDRWTFDGHGSYGSDLSTSPALLPDGTILWPGPGNTLFALDPTGEVLWQERFKGFVLSPAVTPDAKTAYVADTTGALTRIDLAGGHTRTWDIELGAGTSYSSPAITPDGKVVGAVGRRVVAVSDAGLIAWSFETGGDIEVSPAVTGSGVVVIGTNDDYQYGISPTGLLAWRYARKSWSYGSPVATDTGRAWFGDHNGTMTAVDSTTGTLVTRFQPVPADSAEPGSLGVWTAPAVDAEGSVYWGTVSGHVYGYGSDGAKLFDLDAKSIVDSYPALGPDGTLYIGASSGTLYALHD